MTTTTKRLLFAVALIASITMVVMLWQRGSGSSTTSAKQAGKAQGPPAKAPTSSRAAALRKLAKTTPSKNLRKWLRALLKPGPAATSEGSADGDTPCPSGATPIFDEMSELPGPMACKAADGKLLGAWTALQEQTAAERTGEAKVVFRAGQQAYVDKRYEESAHTYLSAYRIYPNSIFFYNAAEAYYKLGDTKRAVHYYRLFLAGDVDRLRLRERAEAQIAALKDAPSPPPH